MLNKTLKLLLAVFILANIYGFAFVASQVAESHKIKQAFPVSEPQALEAVKGALQALSLRLDTIKEIEGLIKVKGKYADGRTIRIEIYKAEAGQSLISVRVGKNESGKPDAQKIMDAIALCIPSGNEN